MISLPGVSLQELLSQLHYYIRHTIRINWIARVGGKHGKLNARKRKRDRKRASNVIIAKTEQETG